MAKVTPTALLKILDRMAKQYQMLLDLEAVISPLAAPGINGRFTDQTLATGNPDFIKYLLDASQLLDHNCTAQNIIRYNNYWTVIIHGINAHLNSEAQHHLLNGYLEDNEILVHEYVSTIHREATGYHLWAKNVFANQTSLLATIEVQPLGTLSLSALNNLGPSPLFREAFAGPEAHGPAPLTITTDPINLTTTITTTIALELTKEDYTTGTVPITIVAGTPANTVIPLGPLRYYALQGATLITGGLTGDTYHLNSTLERTITL